MNRTLDDRPRTPDAPAPVLGGRPPAARTASAVPRPAGRALLAGAVVAGPLFLAAGVAQGVTREGFDFTRHAISQLALGDAGGLQTVNFVVAGVLLLAGAAGLRTVLRGGPGATWGPALIAVFGASFVTAAAFPADPGAGFPAGAPEAVTMSPHGTVHMAAGMVGYLALCAALAVLARPLAARGHRTWALASRLVPVAVLAGFLSSAASVPAFTAGAGLGLCWLAAVAGRLLADVRQNA
ncbi:Protein of unknown function [Streptomyces sp. LaPpAH-199]|uniref:DUF998 domain-containing protein n=1 Tax=Streptomyces TaxID=1883 RepID=UPI000888005E|nr:DUF998 domain-containing protein [Streptomyces sp. LaPpAH-199]MYW80700.1 DUF998 domain-containing protein [Streptomyces sp. SID8369]SDC94489.1 Protein of unknown function [Streptomyces sp. LaPpAH-199]